MRLFISTPAAGGLVCDRYCSSLVSSIYQAMKDEIITDFNIHFQSKESLIHRARNRAALAFLESGFDRFLTIDSDIEWTYEDFRRIITSDKDIVGGIYPLKTFPVVVNFNPLGDKGAELFKTQRGLDYDAFKVFCEKYTDESGEVEVRHVPTGFLCVKAPVFSALSKIAEVYWTFDSAHGEKKGFFSFYPSDVKNGILRSEDYGFCELAVEAGFKCHVNTKVLLSHIGSHVYRLGQFYGEAE